MSVIIVPWLSGIFLRKWSKYWTSFRLSLSLVPGNVVKRPWPGMPPKWGLYVHLSGSWAEQWSGQAEKCRAVFKVTWRQTDHHPRKPPRPNLFALICGASVDQSAQTDGSLFWGRFTQPFAAISKSLTGWIISSFLPFSTRNSRRKINVRSLVSGWISRFFVGSKPETSRRWLNSYIRNYTSRGWPPDLGLKLAHCWSTGLEYIWHLTMDKSGT